MISPNVTVTMGELLLGIEMLIMIIKFMLKKLLEGESFLLKKMFLQIFAQKLKQCARELVKTVLFWFVKLPLVYLKNVFLFIQPKFLT